LNLQAIGKDPTKIGLKRVSGEEFDFSYYHRHHECDESVLNKVLGKSYKEWVMGANETVFDLTWRGKEVKNLVSEHLDIYDYDPGPDNGGYTLVPSKWRDWMDKGFIKTIK